MTAPGRIAGGFTLTELVVVIMIAAILAAFAAARIDVTGFHVEGFADEVAATVRYAQKIAVSQRRNVAVTIAGNSLALTYPDLGQPVRKPPGADPFTLAAPSGVTLAGTSLTFSALGKPTPAGGTLTITGNDSPPTSVTITVEAETGYVH